MGGFKFDHINVKTGVKVNIGKELVNVLTRISCFSLLRHFIPGDQHEFREFQFLLKDLLSHFNIFHNANVTRKPKA